MKQGCSHPSTYLCKRERNRVLEWVGEEMILCYCGRFAVLKTKYISKGPLSLSLLINCRTTCTQVCLVLPGKQPWSPLCSAPGFTDKSLQHLLFSPSFEKMLLVAFCKEKTIPVFKYALSSSISLVSQAPLSIDIFIFQVM